MQSSKTVILGEASEESDNEEIALEDDEILTYHGQDGDGSSSDEENKANIPRTSANEKQKPADSSIFASLTSTGSTLAKFVQLTSTYNPLNQSSIFGLLPDITQPGSSKTTRQTDLSDNTKGGLSLLHKSLFTKNQQLYACINHLYRQPFEKASKDLHNISHRLVNIQKGIQDIETAIIKLGREQKNLDIDICMLTEQE